jgi:hypothetical protein
MFVNSPSPFVGGQVREHTLEQIIPGLVHFRTRFAVNEMVGPGITLLACLGDDVLLFVRVRNLSRSQFDSVLRRLGWLYVFRLTARRWGGNMQLRAMGSHDSQPGSPTDSEGVSYKPCSCQHRPAECWVPASSFAKDGLLLPEKGVGDTLFTFP